MTTKFQYVGAPTNLGRHGPVATNDFLFLTDDELKTVANDARFVQVDSTTPQREIEILFETIGVISVAVGVASIVLPWTVWATRIECSIEFPNGAATPVTFDINCAGNTILAAPVTIPAGQSEPTSAPVINAPQLAAGSTVTVDIDSAPALTATNTPGNLRISIFGTSPDAPIRITKGLAEPEKMMLRS